MEVTIRPKTCNKKLQVKTMLEATTIKTENKKTQNRGKLYSIQCM